MSFANRKQNHRPRPYSGLLVVCIVAFFASQIASAKGSPNIKVKIDLKHPLHAVQIVDEGNKNTFTVGPIPLAGSHISNHGDIARAFNKASDVVDAPFKPADKFLADPGKPFRDLWAAITKPIRDAKQKVMDWIAWIEHELPIWIAWLCTAIVFIITTSVFIALKLAGVGPGYARSSGN
jgi:hypothetical protein